VKGGNYLDALCNVDTVAFDKTGTLTQGTFRVLEIHPVGCTQEELLDWAARAESCSTHPIAKSLMEAANINAETVSAEEIREIAGRGVSARLDGKQVFAGNAKLMADSGISVSPVTAAGTVVYVAVNGAFMGHILIGDTIRPESKNTLQLLKASGIRQTVMLTGDHQTTAEAVGREVGVDVIHADLLPDEKVAQVETLLARQPAGKKLAFVGDGINDAPVLARADIGIAMGGLGADAAIEAADIVLMDDSLAQLPTAFHIARRTHAIVMQNIIFALGVKLIVLILGALSLANMWAAVFADVGVCLLAILNSLRVLKIK
jgi:Cd2+/Zn2+-exporting ATPase